MYMLDITTYDGLHHAATFVPSGDLLTAALQVAVAMCPFRLIQRATAVNLDTSEERRVK